jgi:DNA repair exonuclease SbcCD ATPase subunit
MAEEIMALLNEMRTEQQQMHAEFRAELQEFRAELEKVNKRLDGLPILERNLATMQRDIRTLTAAFEDFARDNATKGEIKMVHDDLARVHEEYVTLATRMETHARQIRELQDAIRRDN